MEDTSPKTNSNKTSSAQIDETQPEDLEERWMRVKCLGCDYLYEGSKPIHVCPRCGNDDPDKFD